MQSRWIFLVVPLLCVFLACEEEVSSPHPTDYSSIETIQFSQHVQPLLRSRCATGECHNNVSRAAGLDLTSWDMLQKGSDFGEDVVPFRPEASLLVTLFDGTMMRKSHPHLPGPGCNEDELMFLKRWIEEGARDDDGTVPSASAGTRLYVCNQGDDEVAIIDVNDLVVRRYVHVGNSPAIDAPHFIVADESFWYVSLVGAREVWKFDASADTLVAVARVIGSP